MADPLKSVVIGAGICGLGAAIWLRRAGHEVTLVDKDGPGAGASYGNAGLLAQWAMIPVNTPGIAKTGLKYMMDRNAPLFMQWSYLPRMVPWLLKFLSNATDAGVRRTADALMPLIGDSVSQHEALTRGTPAAKWIETGDLTYAYENRAAFDADRYGWGIRQELGYAPEIVEGAAVQDAEPMVGPNVRLLAILRGHGYILNPGAYCQALAEVFEAEGGTLRRATVQDFAMSEGRINAVLTDQGTLPCDNAVLAAGIWSKDLTAKLGFKISLETERGYHLHLKNPSQTPRTPMMMTRGKFGVNPMEHGLRCAGTVELGSHHAPPSKAPLEVIRNNIAWAFPDLTYDMAEEWMGFRPSTPDSLPLVGEIGTTGIFAAFGHQHIGLTAGPKTGRWVADLISGKRPNVDLKPYDANRFG